MADMQDSASKHTAPGDLTPDAEQERKPYVRPALKKGPRLGDVTADKKGSPGDV